MGLSRYRRVLGAPHVLPLVGAALLAALPIGIFTLCIVVFVQRQTGSYAAAGIVAAAAALGAAVGSPMLGRLVDRLGLARVLVPGAIASATGLATLVVLGRSGASPAALAGVAFAAFVVGPPVLPVLRSLWPRLLADEPALVRTGLAVDALLLEAAFVGGPVIAAAFIAWVSPEAGIVAGAGAMAAGALLFVAVAPRPAPGGERHDGGLLGPLRAAGLRTILLATFPIGVMFGGFDVMAPAIAEDVAGRQGVGGVLIALTALGSAAGGLWWGTRGSTGLVRPYLLGALLMPAGLVALSAPDALVPIAVLALLFGAPFAPFSAAGGELAHRLAPAGTLTESFTWVTTSLVSGAACGQALAGAVVEHAGWRSAALVCASVGLAGAGLLAVRRASIAPALAASQ